MALLLVVCLSTTMSASDTDQTPRIAILNLDARSGKLAGLADLIEVELTQEKIEVVERQSLKALLEEQALLASGNTSGRSVAVNMGVVLRARLLVLLSSSADKGDSVRLRILDTRYGLKLRDEVFPTTIPDLGAYVTTIAVALNNITSKEAQEYYAVAPLVNRELSFRFDHLQDSVAHLIRQELLRRGKPVLEYEEARTLLDEHETSSGALPAAPPNLTTIEGAFSVTQAEHKRLELDLELTTLQGEQRCLRAQLPFENQAIGQHIAALVNKIVVDAESSRLPSASQSQPDTVEWLMACGDLHKRIGAWNEARQDFEAALFLNPSCRALRNDLILVYGELIRTVPHRSLPLVEEQRQLLALHEQGVEHIEWVLQNTSQLSDEDVERITAFLQPQWWYRVSLHHPESKRSLQDLDPGIRDAVREHMQRVKAVSAKILREGDAKTFQRHLRSADPCRWYLNAETWVDDSETEKYRRRLQVLSDIGDRVMRYTYWREFLRRAGDPKSAEYQRYLEGVSGIKDANRLTHEVAADLEGRTFRKNKLHRSEPTANKPDKPKQYPDCVTITELHLVDSSTKADFRPRHVSKIISCGEHGDAICLLRQVFFVASPSEATPILDWPENDHSLISDACWDGANLWLAITSRGGPNDRDLILCWNAENRQFRKWDASHGLPMNALNTHTRGQLSRINLCPFGKQVFAVGTQRITAAAPRTWIGSTSPESDKISILFEARDISDRTRDWQTHINMLSLGFVPVGMGVFQSGTATDCWRLLIGRSTGWGQPFPLVLNPSSGHVSVQKVPPPIINVDTMRFCDGRIAWLSSGAIHWSSPGTFEILHSIKNLGQITSWFRYKGRTLAYGHSIMWVDDRDMKVSYIVPNVFDVAPIIRVMAPSKHFGILGLNPEGTLYAVAIDDKGKKTQQ